MYICMYVCMCEIFTALCVTFMYSYVEASVVFYINLFVISCLSPYPTDICD
jgi:hypothetical protein